MLNYHRYGLRWVQVGICILENYNSPGKHGWYNPLVTPVTPTNLPVAKPGD